jgi:hypothetical protein
VDTYLDAAAAYIPPFYIEEMKECVVADGKSFRIEV